MSDLIKKENTVLKTIENVNKVVSEIKDIMGNIHQLSRINSVKEKPFKTIDKQRFDYILDRIKEINDKMYVFSKGSSQFSRRFMTLTMLNSADSVYRVLYQILVQIEDRQNALISNISNLKQVYTSLLKLKEEYEKQPPEDNYSKILLELKLQELETGLANSFSYIEAALKEIGYFIEMYEEIKRNKNIPDDWDEYDYETDEIKANIKHAFRNAIRDIIAHGSIGVGTSEYFEQLGISPIEANYYVRMYFDECNVRIQHGHIPDYDHMYEFLDKMAELFKDNYKKACKRIGLDEDYISKKFTLISNKKNLEKIQGLINE